MREASPLFNSLSTSSFDNNFHLPDLSSYGIIMNGILHRANLIVNGEVTLKCDLCGKSPQFGHNVSHSKRRTNRRWVPNIHRATITIDGQPKRLNLCTRCLRTQHKLARAS